MSAATSPDAPSHDLLRSAAERTGAVAPDGAGVSLVPDLVLIGEDDVDTALDALASSDARENPIHGKLALVVAAGASTPARRRARAFAVANPLALPLDVAHAGRPAVVAADAGLVGSGHVVVGFDPDVGALGGVGALPLKIGPLDLARLAEGHPLQLPWPPVARVTIDGRPPRWCGGFELAVATLEAARAAGVGPGCVLELGGATVAALDLPARLELCATLAAAGLVGRVEADAKTASWLAARRARPARSRPAAPAGHADPSGRPAAGADPAPGSVGASSGPPGAANPLQVTLDAARAGPVALVDPWPGTPARPGDPQFEHSPWRAGDGPAEVVLAGRLEALRAASALLRERNVAPGVDLLVVPASQRTLLHALDEGLVSDLLRAGATWLPPGAPIAPRDDAVRRLSTVGGGAAEVVASATLAAASAALGRLADPESVHRMPRRGSLLS